MLPPEECAVTGLVAVNDPDGRPKSRPTVSLANQYPQGPQPVRAQSLTQPSRTCSHLETGHASRKREPEPEYLASLYYMCKPAGGPMAIAVHATHNCASRPRPMQ